MQQFIQVTEQSLKRFKRAYNKAKPKEVFNFEGKEFLKEYAGYMIEYLEKRFKCLNQGTE